MREEKSFSQRAFSIYTDIRKLQDKAQTSYTLSTRRLRFGYEQQFARSTLRICFGMIREEHAVERELQLCGYFCIITSGYYTLPLEDDTKVSSLNFNRDFLTAEWIRVSEFSGPYTQLHVSSQRELEVAAKLLKGDYLHRAIVLEEDITISNLTEPYFDRLEYDCYIKGSYTENGEEKHHKITLEHATAPLINENVGTIDGIDILGTVNGKEEASGEDTCFGAFARKNYGAIQNCRIVGTTNSFNEIIRSRIEGSAEYFGGFAGHNYGYITH